MLLELWRNGRRAGQKSRFRFLLLVSRRKWLSKVKPVPFGRVGSIPIQLHQQFGLTCRKQAPVETLPSGRVRFSSSPPVKPLDSWLS